MLAEGIEIVQRSRLRENSGSMEFAETKEVSRWSPRELRWVCSLHFKVGRSTKSFKWRAYVMSGGVSTRLHAQYLPQGKEKLLLRDILCLKRRSCLPPPALYSDSWIARSKYYGGITTANELQLPPSLRPVKVLSQMTPTWNYTHIWGGFCYTCQLVG